MEQPVLQKRQVIEIGEESHWPLYFKIQDDDLETRYAQQKPVAFAEDGQSFRIGSAVLMRNSEGDFKAQKPGYSDKDRLPAYFEEFATRSGLLVVASRRNDNYLSAKSDVIEDPLQDLVTMFTRANIKHREGSTSNTDDSGSDPEDGVSSNSSEDSWSSANESWTEASTELSDALEDENFLERFKGYNDSSDSTSTSDEETESELSSASDLGANPFARFRRGFQDDGSDADEAYIAFGDSDSDENIVAEFAYIEARQRLKKQAETNLQASIQVLGTSESGMKHLFRLRQPLHLPLYDSPPAIHPSEPLVVWPLGPSTVLFLDYERKQYFTRKLRPTTSMTRQVFIKCHFAPDGRHLHIATLEGHRKPLSRAAQRKLKRAQKQGAKMAPDEPILLSLFLSTYRLHPTKPTRTPPTQIHRAKLTLDKARSLPVARLPFSVTWTPDHLYVTQSAKVLRVHRVRLFPLPKPAQQDPEQQPGHHLHLRPQQQQQQQLASSASSTTAVEEEEDETGADLVLAEPREVVLLPSTASARPVRFFPAPGGSAGGAARVLIGSGALLSGQKPRSGSKKKDGVDAYSGDHGDGGDKVEGELKYEGVVQGLEGRAALPVGVFLREREDLGGWVRSACAVRVPENRGVGRLDDKVERFDVDDCDLEPYIV